MIRRHPFISFILLVALVAGGLFAYALATFDLNAYRGAVQEHLSSALHRPVTMGTTDLTLRRGPAISFEQILIGSPGEKNTLAADRLLMRLDWPSLLKGKILFSRILLVAPRIELETGSDSTSPKVPALPDLPSLEIRSFEVENGRVLLSDGRSPKTPPLEISGLEGAITGLSAGHPAWLRLKGAVRQGGLAAPLALAGEVNLPATGADWGDIQINLGLVLDPFPPAPFLEPALRLPAGALSGTGRLEMTLNGSPATALGFQIALAQSRVRLTLPTLYSSPLPLPDFQVQGKWTAGPSEPRLRDLSLSAGALKAQGDISVREEMGSTWVDARLKVEPLSATELLKFLPDRPRGWAALHEQIRGGTMEIRELRFAGPASALRSAESAAQRLSGEAALNGWTAQLPGVGPLTELSLALRMKDDLLLLEAGKAVVLGSPVAFAGALEHPLGPEPDLLMEAEGEIRAERLASLLTPDNRREMEIRGAVAAALGLQARKGRMQIDLRADLQQMEAGWKKLVQKRAGHPAKLLLTAEVTPERLSLDFAHLRLPALDLRARGFRQLAGTNGFSLTVEAASSDLAATYPIFPVLEPIRGAGGANLELTLSGDGRKIRRDGSLTLHDAGFHVTRFIADLRRVNGTVRLAEDKVIAEHLSLHLGNSPLVVSGSMTGPEDFRIALQVHGRSIRADELVFPSPTKILRDVEGALVIDQHHIAFDPVRVRMDGGTRALVTGEVAFEPPRVELDIHAKHGNIDEVIALWETPNGTAAEPKEEVPQEENRTRVRITARADEGNLGNLPFQKAEGVITWEKGVLAIHPLHFRSGEGYCTARVQVEGGMDGSILSTSGHLEDFDAAQIYSQMLKRRGLVTGTLRGDFSIEGKVGEGFTSTCRGGVNAEIDKGVLRKFNSLAKIFSLLNVSQILSLQLPDMARDGMPYNRLTATVGIDRGVLHTEDLFVDSNAMNLSLVGNLDLNTEKLDLVMGLKPLRTVDKIVTNIPVAGWLLTGEEKALITAHFTIRGPAENPEVSAVPITSVSQKAIGIFRRVLGLPGRMVENVGTLMNGRD